MIILKILGIFFLIILILLFFPVVLKITHKGETTDFSIKFLFLSFKNIGKTKKKTNTKQEKKTKKKKQSKTEKVPEEKQKEKTDIKKLLKMSYNAINSGSKAFIKLVKGVRIYDIEIYFLVAGTDAYKTALKFATVEGAFHTHLAVISNALDVRLKKVIIEPNFINNNEVYDYNLKIKIKPITVVCCLIYFAYKFGITLLKPNNE
ncbi:MAG: hypothetical protein RR048_00905 [Oscillospiraceae bacterium]